MTIIYDTHKHFLVNDQARGRKGFKGTAIQMKAREDAPSHTVTRSMPMTKRAHHTHSSAQDSPPHKVWDFAAWFTTKKEHIDIETVERCAMVPKIGDIIDPQSTINQ